MSEAAAETKTEVWFYHLERQPLEGVLPSLVQRTLARGWRAVVQAGTAERLDAIDTLLWTFADDSFVPHGTARDGDPGEQPVFLTLTEENPSQAAIRFLVDGATLSRFSGYLRVVLIFDGHETAAVERARAQWKAAKAEGCSVTYWQQTSTGAWERKA